MDQEVGAKTSRPFEGDGSIPRDAKYRIRPGYAVRAFMDEYLLIPVGAPGAKNAKMAVLSPVAEFIWEQLGEPRSVGELLQAVTDEFEADEAEAEQDILEFLNELRKQDFLLTEDEANETV